MPTLSREFTIPNAKGLHARAATAFVKIATAFDANVIVRRGHTTANGKQIMMLLILAAPQGCVVEIETEGPQAHDAMDALGALIEAGFGE
jgi:phosphocarrier protein HPr